MKLRIYEIYEILLIKFYFIVFLYYAF